jgi:AI-2 transport protein TqsA
MNEDACRSLRPLLVVIVVILVVAAMRVTAVVTVPAALALFIVILAWPLQVLLEKKFPRVFSYLLTLLAILVVFAFFVGLLVLAAQSVAAKAPEYEQRLAGFIDRVQLWAEWRNIEINADEESPEMMNRVVAMLQGLAKWTYQLLGFFALTVTFTVLGLIEVHSFRLKLTSKIGGETARKLIEVGKEVSWTLQRYMLIRTGVSASTGILVGLFTWAIGLDFPLVWGVAAFLLNYIPILGSIVAVIPPTVLAFIQPGEIWMGFVTLGGLTLIQFSIGNYVDPRLEGYILSLSPVVLFFSIVFWGWVWSIPGALMGIPITASIVIFCRRFENTQWLAELLAKKR